MQGSALNCVILAAGLSRRAGENKLLKKVQGIPLCLFIMRKIAELYSADLLAGGRVVVVTNYSDVADLAHDLGFETVSSPQAQLGKSYSLRSALAVLGDTDPIMFCVADQPYVSIDTLNSLIQEHLSHPESIIYPLYAGKRGNPMIFPSAAYESLKSLEGDQGGAKIIADFPSKAVLVDDVLEAKDFDLASDFTNVSE